MLEEIIHQNVHTAIMWEEGKTLANTYIVLETDVALSKSWQQVRTPPSAAIAYTVDPRCK